MYYCPSCKKKFKKYRRRCPECGGPCHRSDNRAILLIVTVGVLFLLLIGLILLLGSTANTSQDETTSSSILSSAPESSGSVPGSSAPPSSSTPATSVPASSAPPISGIGLYTREELEAMDTTYSTSGFGAGRGSNHARPSTPVSEQKKYSQYDAHFIGADTKTAYLTFDCGYEYYATDANGKKYPVTGKILDVLKEKNIKGVFFITMDYAEMEPALVQRMIDEGHIVGNHSVNHLVMPSLTIDEMVQEVMGLHDYVLENFGYKMHLFRPPTGAYSIQSLAVLQNLGYKTVLWSFQHYDYDTNDQPSYDTAYKVITNNSHNGAIYLLHAISEANAAVLGDVIDYLHSEGYEIKLFS